MALSRSRTVLTADQIDAALRALPGFHRDERGHLRCRWRFPDFARAFAFATRIAELAEQQDHHPDLTVGWGHVSIELWTHDRSGITRRDLDLAAAIAALGHPHEPAA